MDTSALQEAIDIAGGQSALARSIAAMHGGHIRQGSVWSWLHRDLKVPPEYCEAIEISTGVLCERLRPDLTWLRDEGRVVGYCVHFSESK